MTPNASALVQDLEVENCTLTAPMASVSDATASNGFYVATTVAGDVTPASGGTAVCTFKVGADGWYRGWARVQSQDDGGNTDSFFIRWDSETAPAGSTPGPSTHIFDIAEQITCPPASQPAPSSWGLGWVWNIVNDRSVNCNGSTTVPGYERTTTSGDSTPGQFLSAGTHTLTVYGREVGAKIDRIIITTNLSYDPRASVSLTPTPSVQTCRKWVCCKNKCGYITVPCSAINRNYSRPCVWR